MEQLHTKDRRDKSTVNELIGIHFLCINSEIVYQRKKYPTREISIIGA